MQRLFCVEAARIECVDVGAEEAREEGMHLLLMDGFGTHFPSSIRDMTSRTKQPSSCLTLWLKNEGMARPEGTLSLEE
jgi:hypothetical protein